MPKKGETKTEKKIPNTATFKVINPKIVANESALVKLDNTQRFQSLQYGNIVQGGDITDVTEKVVLVAMFKGPDNSKKSKDLITLEVRTMICPNTKDRGKNTQDTSDNPRKKTKIAPFIFKSTLFRGNVMVASKEYRTMADGKKARIPLLVVANSLNASVNGIITKYYRDIIGAGFQKTNWRAPQFGIAWLKNLKDRFTYDENARVENFRDYTDNCMMNRLHQKMGSDKRKMSFSGDDTDVDDDDLASIKYELKKIVTDDITEEFKEILAKANSKIDAAFERIKEKHRQRCENEKKEREVLEQNGETEEGMEEESEEEEVIDSEREVSPSLIDSDQESEEEPEPEPEPQKDKKRKIHPGEEKKPKEGKGRKDEEKKRKEMEEEKKRKKKEKREAKMKKEIERLMQEKKEKEDEQMKETIRKEKKKEESKKKEDKEKEENKKKEEDKKNITIHEPQRNEEVSDYIEEYVEEEYDDQVLDEIMSDHSNKESKGDDIVGDEFSADDVFDM